MLATLHLCYDYLLDFYRGVVPFLFLIKVLSSSIERETILVHWNTEEIIGYASSAVSLQFYLQNLRSFFRQRFNITVKSKPVGLRARFFGLSWSKIVSLH